MVSVVLDLMGIYSKIFVLLQYPIQCFATVLLQCALQCIVCLLLPCLHSNLPDYYSASGAIVKIFFLFSSLLFCDLVKFVRKFHNNYLHFLGLHIHQVFFQNWRPSLCLKFLLIDPVVEVYLKSFDILLFISDWYQLDCWDKFLLQKLACLTVSRFYWARILLKPCLDVCWLNEIFIECWPPFWISLSD